MSGIKILVLMGYVSTALSFTINTQNVDRNNDDQAQSNDEQMVLKRFPRFLTDQRSAEWSDWKNASACSTTCGIGVMKQTRTCLLRDQVECRGSDINFVQCNIQPCSTAHWNQWSDFSACSEKCGKIGVQHRTRDCSTGTNLDCQQNNNSTFYQVETCNNGPCDAPAWTEWSDWSPCSLTCGQGVCWRTRKCNHGQPSDCIGNTTDITSCYVTTCSKPVKAWDGGWSDWTRWSPCKSSHPCSVGVVARTRTCTNPAPTPGGANCTGSNVMYDKCVSACTGSWSHWENATQCSATCGNGTYSQARKCSTGNDTQCTGNSTRILPCVLPACPDVSNRSWSSWGDWSKCSASCGVGVQHRTRVCVGSIPIKQSSAPNCTGESTSFQTCTNACPGTTTGHWSDWFPTGGCSVTCGNGAMRVTRYCSTGNNGDCVGNSTRTVPCTNDPCPAHTTMDGAWSDWSAWSVCSQTCGHGVRSRSRACDNPAPSGGGFDCKGNNTESSSCMLHECPEWSQWFGMECSVSCGGGVQHRLRHCSSGRDVDCPGVAMDTVHCNKQFVESICVKN